MGGNVSKEIKIFGLLMIALSFMGFWGMIGKSLPDIIVLSLLLISGLGILKQKNWARLLGIGVFTIINIYLFINILKLMFEGAGELKGGEFWLFTLLSLPLLFGILMIYFFTRPKAKEQFK